MTSATESRNSSSAVVVVTHLLDHLSGLEPKPRKRVDVPPRGPRSRSRSNLPCSAPQCSGAVAVVHTRRAVPRASTQVTPPPKHHRREVCGGGFGRVGPGDAVTSPGSGVPESPRRRGRRRLSPPTRPPRRARGRSARCARPRSGPRRAGGAVRAPYLEDLAGAVGPAHRVAVHMEPVADRRVHRISFRRGCPAVSPVTASVHLPGQLRRCVRRKSPGVIFDVVRGCGYPVSAGRRVWRPATAGVQGNAALVAVAGERDTDPRDRYGRDEHVWALNPAPAGFITDR